MKKGSDFKKVQPPVIFNLHTLRDSVHIFNAVYPEHPTKSDYYVERAHKVGLEPPSFENHYSMETYKRVDSDNLKQILNYHFKKSIHYTDSGY